MSYFISQNVDKTLRKKSQFIDQKGRHQYNSKKKINE